MTASDEGILYRRADGVVARRVAGELLLVPVGVRTIDTVSRAAELFVLNESGELLWDWLAEPIGVADLARNLMREYEISMEQATADASGFIHSMRAVGMVDQLRNGLA
jgi:hypothetical protein